MTTQKRPSYNFFLSALYITSRAFAHQSSATDHEKVHKLTGQAGTGACFYSGTVGWIATVIWKYVLANQPQASPLRPWTDDYWRCHQKQFKILPPPHALSLHLSGPGTTIASHLPNALRGRESVLPPSSPRGWGQEQNWPWLLRMWSFLSLVMVPSVGSFYMDLRWKMPVIVCKQSTTMMD